MFTPVIIGDIVFFFCGVVIGHYGPKAVLAFVKKEAKTIKKAVKK
jgi:hypothetical protein